MVIFGDPTVMVHRISDFYAPCKYVENCVTYGETD
jgi:hypothetical protein